MTMTSHCSLLFVAFLVCVMLMPHADTSVAATRNVNRKNPVLSKAAERELEKIFDILRKPDWAKIILPRLLEEKERRQAADEQNMKNATTDADVDGDGDERRTHSDGTRGDAIRRLRRSVPNGASDHSPSNDSPIAANDRTSQKSTTNSLLVDVEQVPNQRLELAEFSGDTVRSSKLDTAKQENVDQFGTSGNPPHSDSDTTTEHPSHYKRPTRFNVLSENLSDVETQAATSEPSKSFYSSSGSDQASFADGGDLPSTAMKESTTSTSTSTSTSTATSTSILTSPTPHESKKPYPPCPSDADLICIHGECLNIGCGLYELYSCNCNSGYIGVLCEHMHLLGSMQAMQFVAGDSNPAAAAAKNPSDYSAIVAVAQYFAGDVKTFR